MEGPIDFPKLKAKVIRIKTKINRRFSKEVLKFACELEPIQKG